MKVEQIIKCVSCKTRCKYRQFSWKKSKKSEKLRKGDDMDIMSELILLSEQLSLSSDLIGDNPNMP